MKQNAGTSQAASQKAGALVIPRKRFELPGGGVLLVSRRPKAPVTSIQIFMRGGIHTDPLGQEGLAQYVGQYLDQGTSDKDDAAIAECIEPFGGSVSGDAQGLRGSMAGDKWRELMDIMVELTSQPTFPDELIGVQLERTRSHLAVQEEDPRVQGGRLFRRLVYGEHRLGRPAGGTLASVGELSGQHLREHHASTWGRARAIIAVCGDVEPDQVYEHLVRQLDRWPVGPEPLDPDQQFPERTPRVEAFEKGREQVHIYYGHLGVRRKVSDYPALVILDHVLGSGPGFVNRLSKKLRDEQGLAYSVHGGIHQSAGRLPGMFTAYIGTSPEHLEQAVTGIQKEVRAICEKVVDPEELAMAKDYVTGSMVLGYERASRRAASLIAHELYGFPEDHLELLRGEYEKVTAQDVLAAAQKNLFPDAACLAASGSVTTSQLSGLMGL